ncbi:MAG: hypothetical protein LBR56_01725, partial [Sporomusaceae bacterium]|nr:hypothetical protein [Sporomusaceae bacterium]
MNKKYYLLGLLSVSIILAIFLRAEAWLSQSNKEDLKETSTLTSLETTLWREGKRQWLLKAQGVLSQNNLRIFFHVKDSVFFRPDEGELRLEAARLEYDEEQSNFNFPQGLKIRTENKCYTLQAGKWDFTKKLFTAKSVVLEQADGRLQMSADEMLYDEEKNKYFFSGNIVLNADLEAAGKIKIKADKLVYEQKQWLAAGMLSIELSKGEDLAKITATQIIF